MGLRSTKGKTSDMLKKLYDQSKLCFALMWIVGYCVLMSVGDALSAVLGVEKSVTLAVGLGFSAILLLFLRKNGIKAAVIVSSVTFGIGHIINLFNGAGAELLPNLLQVMYATAAGFMFVLMYETSKSLIGCIAAHGIFNALSVFADEAAATQGMRIGTAILLTVITGGYAGYLARSMQLSQITGNRP